MTLKNRIIAASVVALTISSCTSGDDSDGDVGVPGEQVAADSAPSTVETSTTVAPTTTPTTAAPTTTTTIAPTTTAAPATTSAPNTTAAPVVTQPPGPFYRSGDEGTEVAVLQLKLETVGFLAPGYTAGLFDAATNRAVLDFQGQYGLVVDGIVGPETDRALTAAAVSVNPESG